MKHSKGSLPRQPIVIIGAGRWGKALSLPLKDGEHPVFKLNGESTDIEWEKALEQSTIALLAPPFSAIPEVLKKLAKYPHLEAVINASKGIDRKSRKPFSLLAKDILKVPFFSLSGPSFANELSKKKPTALALAGTKSSQIQSIAKAWSTSYFRIYAHHDPVGVDLCGAFKNVIAIAAGVCAALKLGNNAQAALITRGLREMLEFVQALKGQPTTVFGLAGLGDLVLTANSKQSRNYRFGTLLGQGETPAQAKKIINQPVEGFYTVSQVEALRKQYKKELPIAHECYLLCQGKTGPQAALDRLMKRDIKTEESSLWKLR